MLRSSVIMLGLVLLYVSTNAQSSQPPQRNQGGTIAFSGDDATLVLNMKGGTKPSTKPKNKPCDGELFDGQDRTKAKLSLGTGQVETFDNLTDMIAQLPADKFMGEKHAPAIGTDSKSVRVKEELRNVHVKQAWIYTYTRESDEDYHVMLGTDPSVAEKIFFDMEVSGLPPAGASDESDLKKVREAFTTHFGITGCISSYTDALFSHPVEVEVTGSLFFDKRHYTDQTVIGHGIAKATRYWEIHPATEIIFK